jgi:5'-nucleotidase
MPNDAKLGLVIGVGLLIAVAVVFFRKELGASATSVDPPPANGVQQPTTPARPTSNRVVSAAPTAATPARVEPRRHTVREGDTLFGLAQEYYGDGEKFRRIGEANGASADAHEALTVGTVLVIPESD